MAELVRAWGYPRSDEQSADRSAVAEVIGRMSAAGLSEIDDAQVIKTITEDGQFKSLAEVRAVKR